MVFSSHLFCFLFLPVALAAYAAAPRRARNLVLTAASYVFYGWANPAFVLVMLASTAIDYACGRLLVATRVDGREGDAPLDPTAPRHRLQRTAVATSVIANLGLLAFFKYANFAVSSADEALRALGLDGIDADGVLRVALPLGISFYTFQSMSYTIDVYRGRAAALRDPLDFACYVAMFPQLVAGPIVRFSEVADQLRERRHDLAKVARGAAFFCLGMAKKVLLANPCGRVADTVFDAAARSVVDAWLGALAYAFQIYFDFSGYSDMAIGLGLVLGFTFPKNFDSPYRATSIADFWRRWHMSLSRWLRDYLYVPLGGNRHGTLRTYRNLMLVMLLGGLWHGAAWTFVLWGAYHGLLLAGERAWGERPHPPRAVRVAVTFLLTLFGWVLFRAANLGDAVAYLATMLGRGGDAATAALVGAEVHRPYYLATLLVAAVVVWAAPQTWDWTRRLTAPRVAVAVALFWLALTLMETQGYNPFIYFIF